jgi:YbbR domain-containing protein
MTDTAPKTRPYGLFVTMAVALVLLVGGLLFFGRSVEITLPLSIEFKSIPHELVLVGRVPVMEAHIKGPVGRLRGLEDSKLSHEIDLASAEPGKLRIEMLPKMVKAPQGTSVSEIHPASFFIGIEKRKDKLVPVVPDLSNEPVPGYVVSAVVASPSSVRLTGPASMLDRISAVRTTPVDLAGLTESTRRSVALNLNHSPHVQLTDKSLIEVRIDVEEKIVEESFLTHVEITGTDYTVEIRPEQIELVLRGPENTLRKLVQEDGIRVRVDLKRLEPGTYLRHAVIEPPLNTTLVEARPKAFSVTIHK